MEILSSCPLARKSMERRTRELQQRSMTRMEGVSLQAEPRKRKPRAPHLTAEQRAQIEERKKKRMESVPEEPPFRPEVQKYADYLKVKEAHAASHERPKGWGKAVERHREGWETHMEQVKEATTIRPLPPVPKPKRSSSVAKTRPPASEPLDTGQSGEGAPRVTKAGAIPTPVQTVS
jgi:hypothetical protein